MSSVWIVVSYDITNDRRRNRIFDILKSYGQHVQYSVFECELSRVALVQLRNRLDLELKPSEGDSIRYYFLCEACSKKVERIGGPIPINNNAEFI